MNKVFKTIKADSLANKSNPEVVVFLAVFRLSNSVKMAVQRNKLGVLLLPVYTLIRLIYKALSIIYLMELPVETNVGKGLTIHHLKGTVINSSAVIGENVTINHFVTIAENIIIEDNVVINPLSIIVKGRIGSGSIVGAGSVVTKDVAVNTIVAGCPAKVIGQV